VRIDFVIDTAALRVVLIDAIWPPRRVRATATFSRILRVFICLHLLEAPIMRLKNFLTYARVEKVEIFVSKPCKVLALELAAEYL